MRPLEGGLEAWIDAGGALEEGPEVPGSGEREVDLEVDDLAEPALGDGVLQSQHHRREAELEVHGGGEAPGAADL